MKRSTRAAAQYLRLIRPKQWIKNLFVLAVLVFSRSFMELRLVLLSLAAFFAFCLVSSAVYIINDIADAEADRLHPVKRLRPIASGAVTRPAALGLAAILGAGGAVLAFAVNIPTGVITLSYLAMNILYSLGLKKIVLLDAIIIALGFLIRVVAGGLAIDKFISSWILLCTFLLSLFLGFAKRRCELATLAEDAEGHRKNLRDYTPGFTDQLLSITAAATIMSYSLYTFSVENQAMMATIVFVIYGIFRYLHLVYVQKTSEPPDEAVLSDKPLLIDATLWAVVSAAIFYFS